MSDSSKPPAKARPETIQQIAEAGQINNEMGRVLGEAARLPQEMARQVAAVAHQGSKALAAAILALQEETVGIVAPLQAATRALRDELVTKAIREAATQAAQITSLVELHKAQERAGLAAALAAGIAGLPEVEREWLAADPTRRDALAALLRDEQEALSSHLNVEGRDHSEGERPGSRLEGRRRPWCASVDALAAEDTPDGRLVQASLRRLWAKAWGSWRTSAEGWTGTEAALAELAAEQDGIAKGDHGRFYDIWDRVPADGIYHLAELEGLALWPEVRDAWRSRNAPALATRYVLTEEDGGARKGDRSADTALRVRVEEELRVAGEVRPEPFRLLPPEPSTDTLEASRAAGLFLWDEWEAVAVETLGSEGSELRAFGQSVAAKLRTQARQRWEAWATLPLPGEAADPPPWTGRWRSLLRFTTNLARALWKGEVRARLDRERTKPAAVPHGVLRGIEGSMRPNLTVEVVDDQRLLFDPRTNAPVAHVRRPGMLGVPLIDARALDALASRFPKLLATKEFPRTLGWLVLSGHAQYLAGNPDPRRSEVDGGWDALAEIVGGKAELVKDVVMSMAHLEWPLPNGATGNLCSYIYRPGHRGQRARVTLLRNDPIMPGYTAAIEGSSLQAREARRLVPWLLPSTFATRPNDHGKESALWIRLLLDMRERGAELASGGGVEWTDATLKAHGQVVGLAPAATAAAVRLWLATDNPDSPAMLERLEGTHRYRLGPAHAAARDFMADGALLALAGGKGGALRSAKKRQAVAKEKKSKAKGRRS